MILVEKKMIKVDSIDNDLGIVKSVMTQQLLVVVNKRGEAPDSHHTQPLFLNLSAINIQIFTVSSLSKGRLPYLT